MKKINIYNFITALEAILQYKTRSALTSLGIICGVASVIAMIAIGRGAEEEIISKMKLLGTNNIVIKPLTKQKIKEAENENSESDKDISKKKKSFSPGLTMKDMKVIRETMPYIKSICSEIVKETKAVRNGFHKSVKLVGVENSYFDINNFDFFSGRPFNDDNTTMAREVCIIGSSVKTKFFPTSDPIGGKIKCGDKWLTVTGVLKPKNLSKENISSLGIRDYNMDIYIPISTMLLRYENRALVTKRDVGNDDEAKIENPNQLDRIIVSVTETKYMSKVAEVLSRMLNRLHNKVNDYEIVVPQLLLEQEQSTQRIFKSVLIAIAAISLIVGGIGIMNIMLASVMERTKEIGIRMALGALKKDILIQFLSESVTISLFGGIFGIISGVVLSHLIEGLFEIQTIISFLSIIVSFIVSITIGIAFGLWPAWKAAKQDPITSLRYE